ncbi:hypothetical protein GFK26_18500 [Variovorax paradoxus]|uniref:Uncharacterized protein n=1 Tax=Variovorax paradoxus TaxID=34073 RepID=A0A5Q0M611_VARPD|nr:hypothetical protein [Variovorax paradoxus]QFZ84618.1 hypothetical protein GFK26_18500 [Variovorax paradoxus]
MDTFKTGSAVVSLFSLKAGEGVLAPISMRWRVLDEEGNLIAPWAITAVVPGAESVDIRTDASMNTLVPPQLRGIRIVELEVTTADGVTLLELAHQLETSKLLVPGINSFQTYYQAVLEAQLYTDETMAGWVSQAEPSVRVRALSEAFDRIRMMPVVIEWENDQSIIRDVFNDPPRLRDLNSEQILRLDTRLMKALKKAQLVEANSILDGDPARQLRVAGIQSMTVGESSQNFSAGRPVDTNGVCESTAKILARWVRGRVRIGRA